MKKNQLFIWGAGGHAKVVHDVARLSGNWEVTGFLDDSGATPNRDSFLGLPVFSSRGILSELLAKGTTHAFVAIGDGTKRLELHDYLVAQGFKIATLRHPSSTVASDVRLGEGTLVAAGAIVNPGTSIGRQVILNTGCSVDHDCIIEAGAHICPGSHLAGKVTVKKGAWIGIGATISQGLTIGSDTVVGAGAVVIRDLADRVKAVGVPAKAMGSVSKVTPLKLSASSPRFPEKLHVGRPNLGSREVFNEYVNGIFERRYLSNGGPLVLELEAEISKRLQVKHAIVVCNATIALEVLVKAMDLKGEVIVPSFTFIATAHCLTWVGVKPVFCDIDPMTHNADPLSVKKLITKNTSAILAVHLWGRPAPIRELQKIADEAKIKLFFDACHAFGNTYHGKPIGNFGEAEVFSLHATKFLNSGEGGVITTNNDQLAQEIRKVINFGFFGFDNVVTVGTNGKMNEVSAALGLTNLKEVDHFISTNRKNYERYQNQISRIPGLKLIDYDLKERNNYQYVVVEVDPTAFGMNRDELSELLWKENVLSRKYFNPACHRMEPYRSADPTASDRLPHTEWLKVRTLALPTGTAVSFEEIDAVMELIRAFHQKAQPLRKAG